MLNPTTDSKLTIAWFAGELHLFNGSRRLVRIEQGDTIQIVDKSNGRIWSIHGGVVPTRRYWFGWTDRIRAAWHILRHGELEE